jgi:hypothetical protein
MAARPEQALHRSEIASSGNLFMVFGEPDIYPARQADCWPAAGAL